MKSNGINKCVSYKRPFFSWYYLRLFCTGLILLPIALVLTLIRRSLLLIRLLFLRRPIIKEPIHFIRSESMKEIDDWNPDDEEKKTQEWLKNFDDPQILENARYICEYNYHLALKPQTPYNEYDDPLV